MLGLRKPKSPVLQERPLDLALCWVWVMTFKKEVSIEDRWEVGWVEAKLKRLRAGGRLEVEAQRVANISELKGVSFDRSRGGMSHL